MEFSELIVPGDEDDNDGDGPAYSYYKSTKILGRLYDAVDETKIWQDDINKPKPKPQAPHLSFWHLFVDWAQRKSVELRIAPIQYWNQRDRATEIRSA